MKLLISHRRGIALGALAALVLMQACHRAADAPTGRRGGAGGGAVSVATAKVQKGSLHVYLSALGTVTPVYTVSATSRVTGELTEIHYSEGQIIKKNDLLAVIDPRPYNAALEQAHGQLSRDEAQLSNARQDLSRYQQAFAQHAIPEQQLATQSASVKQAEGTVEIDRGMFEAARLNLEFTQIRSPIDGRVGLRQVDLGNQVQANGSVALATITQLQPITVVFTLSEDDLDSVLAAMRAVASPPVDAFDRSGQTKLASGTLLTIDNQINPTTGTVRAKASFANTKNELFPNQFVNARLLIRTLDQVNLVPTAAIQHNNESTYVYVLQPDSSVQSKEIKVTATDGEISAVTGIDPGQTIIADGFDKLQAGVKVTVRQAPTPAGGAAGPNGSGSGKGGSPAGSSE